MLICINAGYYNTKVKTLNGEYIHESKIQKNDDAGRYIVIDNEKYEIGEGVRDIGNKDRNDVHMYCTLYNILKRAKHFDRVNLMLALPMSTYLNKNYREEYKNKFAGQSFNYAVDGEFKSVIVNDATVCMEGAAAMLLHRQQYQGAVGMIDIGGNTVNCAVFKDGKILLDTVTTLDLGMIKLERALIDELNIRKGLNVQSYEVETFIGSKDSVVVKVINKHLEEIRQRLLEKKWNVGHLPLVATGGGASDLRDYLPKYFGRVHTSDNPVLDNVRGLWLAGQVIYK